MTETVLARSRKWDESTGVENDICRICLSISDFLIPIFSGEGLEQKLQEKLDKHLPVKISKTDVFPQQMCYNCANTLITWDALYNCCLKTDKKLQSLLSLDLQNVTIPKDETNGEVLTCRKKVSENQHSHHVKKNSKTKRTCSKRREKLAVRLGNDIPLQAAPDVENLKTTTADETMMENAMNRGEDSRGEEKTEMTGVSSQTSLKCETCDEVFGDKKSLARHVQKVHEAESAVEPLQCDVCNNIYKTRANLERHKVKEHLTDQVTCPVCTASFNAKKLDSHLRSVHGVRPEPESEEKFKCKICEKFFKNKYIRNSHVKEAHQSEPIKCKLCDFEGVRTVLRRHRQNVHVEKRFFCSLCPGAFKTLHTLKMHMTSHSDVRCYTCDVCGMGFKRLNNVRDHMKCHQQKSNQCQICGNFFARKRYLAIHEKTIHNFYADGVVPEEKGFECEICGAKLKWKKNLLAHMRIHTGEKPYVCKICNKDFVCHGTLRTHMGKHNVCAPNETTDQTRPLVEATVNTTLFTTLTVTDD